MFLHVVTHPEVAVDPARPVPQWSLSAAGRERLHRLVVLPWVRTAGFVASSAERKALQTAQAVAAAAGRDVHVEEELGENDRSATGFVPPERFEVLADAFFADPEVSVEGWETAAAAQARIVGAVDRVLDLAARTVPPSGSVVIATHGGVGTLLQCALRGVPVSRSLDQPGQGSWFTVDTADRRVLHGWRRL
ncbi:histidine phosphatase family protein [Kineococcus sp. NPDC059986]|uniref:histidine phosphatase family protein n=1 Tax=Kineococcus sp. NPDC059986 TaxID=3155538 RepID=UPI0034504DD4